MIYGNYLRDKYNNTAVKLANAEGVPCIMERSKGKNVQNYEIYGNSVQDGTPSPDAPIEVQSIGDLVTDIASEYYGKYDVPIIVRGKNLLPNSNWMSGAHSTGFQEQVSANYIIEYTQNSISFKLPAWTGVSSPRFQKDSVKRIVFKINQASLDPDSYVNFYIAIQGYDDDNNKVGSKVIYDNVIADRGYVFDFSRISTYSWYTSSTQFSFCILARKNALNNLMIYDIAYYDETKTSVYEPYIGETKHIYLDEPLRKVGDYADYIDFKNQKVVRNILKQSLTSYNIYKKLSKVIRLSSRNEAGKQKYDTHMLSTILKYNYDWFANTECIFHHSDSNWNYYWSIYWSRLGLTYDGTNVYKTDDTSQTPLTESQIISIAKKWLSTLSDKEKEVYMILDKPTEENISIPELKTFKGTSVISVDTSVKPSNIKAKYIKK